MIRPLHTYAITSVVTFVLASASVAAAGYTRIHASACQAIGSVTYANGKWKNNSGSSADLDCPVEDSDLHAKSTVPYVDTHLYNPVGGPPYNVAQLCVMHYWGGASGEDCDYAVNDLGLSGSHAIRTYVSSSSYVWKNGGNVYDYPFVSVSLRPQAELTGVLVYY